MSDPKSPQDLWTEMARETIGAAGGATSSEAAELRAELKREKEETQRLRSELQRVETDHRATRVLASEYRAELKREKEETQRLRSELQRAAGPVPGPVPDRDAEAELGRLRTQVERLERERAERQAEHGRQAQDPQAAGLRAELGRAAEEGRALRQALASVEEQQRAAVRRAEELQREQRRLEGELAGVREQLRQAPAAAARPPSRGGREELELELEQVLSERNLLAERYTLAQRQLRRLRTEMERVSLLCNGDART